MSANAVVEEWEGMQSEPDIVSIKGRPETSNYRLSGITHFSAKHEDHITRTVFYQLP
jgi:hypothetical protein